MTSLLDTEERWSPTTEDSVTAKDASSAIAKWWNASLDFQNSENGMNCLVEACAFSLMVAQGEDGFTEEELLVLVKKIQELRISFTMGELIAEGLVFVSLVERNAEAPPYEVAFRAVK
jgi:hypothetical protein